VKRLRLAGAIAACTVMSVIVPLAGANVPGVQITSRPANPTSSTSATFQFVNSLDGDAAFECQLDGGAFSSCLTPFTATALTAGQHTFAVRAAGLPSDGDSYTWTVDTTPTSPPTVTLTLPGSVRRATARAGDRTVLLTWAMPKTPGIASVLVRRLVVGDPATTIEYRGLRTSFKSSGLRNGVTYRFVLVAFDRAGNPSDPVVVTATPRASLLTTPEYGARLAQPPLLRWAPVAAAEYFNVQLYRNGIKILSAWPDVGRLQLASRWQYGKSTFTLEPGVYTWYVWPGLGARVDVRYGALLGRSSFVVVARGQG
jgi:hypothetical protein